LIVSQTGGTPGPRNDDSLKLAGLAAALPADVTFGRLSGMLHALGPAAREAMTRGLGSLGREEAR
jgi:hypothetical protein